MANRSLKQTSSVLGLVDGIFRKEVMVCQFTGMTNSQGAMWYGGNMLAYSVPIILLQFIVIFFVTRTIHFLLRPLKQSKVSADILAGLIMGHVYVIGGTRIMEIIFPPGGRVLLEMFSSIGIMFHVFVLGVRADTSMLKRVRRNVALIGISGFVVSYAFGGGTVFMLPHIMVVDKAVLTNLPFVSAINSITSFPVIATLLTDLKILNSEVGRLATWAAMCCDILAYFSTTIMVSISDAVSTSHSRPLWSMVWVAVFLIVIVFALRPLVVHIGKCIPQGQQMKEVHFISIVVLVLLSGLCAELVGKPAYLGTYILGASIPDGPPLGSPLIQKLDILSSEFFLPAKFAIIGMSMDLFAIQLGGRGLVIELVIIFGYLGKFTGVLVPSLLFNMPLNEAVTLALIMSCKGIVDSALYSMMLENDTINYESYTLLLMTMLITTGIGRPLICYIYDPSAKYRGYKTNSLMFSDPHDEIKILVCIHKEGTARAMLNLLEASNPMTYKPMSIVVLNLMELQGRAAAMLVPSIPFRKLKHSESRFEHAAKAFSNFAKQKHGYVFLEHFTSIAPYATMHDDICTVALDKSVNIVIIPFHKHWGFDREVVDSFPSIRMVNQNVLQKAPCSVGVLIDRGQVAAYQTTLTGKSTFRVMMLFIGGADDCEALAYSSRMAEHPNISYILVYLKYSGGKSDVKDNGRTFDDDMIDRFRAATEGNERVQYIEEMVKDAVGITKLLRSMADNYDLCVVGTYHDPTLPVIYGLTEWSDCSELGFIGDLLATSDFQFSVLVVQHKPLCSGLYASQPESGHKEVELLVGDCTNIHRI